MKDLEKAGFMYPQEMYNIRFTENNQVQGENIYRKCMDEMVCYMVMAK